MEAVPPMASMEAEMCADALFTNWVAWFRVPCAPPLGPGSTVRINTMGSLEKWSIWKCFSDKNDTYACYFLKVMAVKSNASRS